MQNKKGKYKIEINWKKKLCIKNRTCHYFHSIIKLEDFDLDNKLIDEKSYKNILIYEISYNLLLGSKPLRIRFNKTDETVRTFDGTRYLKVTSAIKR